MIERGLHSASQAICSKVERRPSALSVGPAGADYRARFSERLDGLQAMCCLSVLASDIGDGEKM